MNANSVATIFAQSALNMADLMTQVTKESE